MTALLPLHHTKRQHARSAGWGRLREGGLWHSTLPLIDICSKGLLASMPLPDIEEVLHGWGARLPTRLELRERDTMGFFIPPIILPDAEQLAKMPRAPGETEVAYQTRIRRDMGSIEWAERLANKFRAELVKRKWDGAKPVGGGIKSQYRDDEDSPPKGREYLEGYDPDGAGPKPPIQAGAVPHSPGPHDDHQEDYGTAPVAVFDGAVPPEPDPVALGVFLGYFAPVPEDYV